MKRDGLGARCSQRACCRPGRWRRPGLGALARSLAGAGHDVRVLAPVDERSGSASSLGVVRHGAVVPLRQVVLPGLETAVVHAVDGPPTLGVRAACAGALVWTPEVVVSGINPGLNTGRLVLHSGTVGAALTAASRDITGVAVSTDEESGAGLASAALLATWLVDVLAALGCPPVALNLNVPARPLDELQGVSAASLSGEPASRTLRSTRRRKGCGYAAGRTRPRSRPGPTRTCSATDGRH